MWSCCSTYTHPHTHNTHFHKHGAWVFRSKTAQHKHYNWVRRICSRFVWIQRMRRKMMRRLHGMLKLCAFRVRSGACARRCAPEIWATCTQTFYQYMNAEQRDAVRCVIGNTADRGEKGFAWKALHLLSSARRLWFCRFAYPRKSTVAVVSLALRHFATTASRNATGEMLKRHCRNMQQHSQL